VSTLRHPASEEEEVVILAVAVVAVEAHRDRQRRS
jgi:hypothetical protein